MGRLAPAILETDMIGFEDAYSDDPWCHVVGGPGYTLCGEPDHRREAVHQDNDPLSSVCSGCGRPKCPDCEWLDWERDA